MYSQRYYNVEQFIHPLSGLLFLMSTSGVHPSGPQLTLSRHQGHVLCISSMCMNIWNFQSEGDWAGTDPSCCNGLLLFKYPVKITFSKPGQCRNIWDSLQSERSDKASWVRVETPSPFIDCLTAVCFSFVHWHLWNFWHPIIIFHHQYIAVSHLSSHKRTPTSPPWILSMPKLKCLFDRSPRPNPHLAL